MKPTRALGNWGENKAADFLIELGFLILERNWRYKHREIDIIARDGEDLVFIEVKTRHPGQFGFPEESITRKQRKAIMSAAMVYLRTGVKYRDIRFDVVSIQVKNDVPDILHIRDAFV
ncbi:MAG: YraN family protein [Chitinophagaceae bacterium]